MARLKVKQISDFTSAVNGLIGSSQIAVDDSIDSLESQLSEGLDSLGVIDSSISNALTVEMQATDNEIGSLEVIDSAVSNALAAEILATDGEIGSLEVIDSAVSNALAAEILATDNEVGSLEVIDSAVSNALDALDTTVGNIDIGSLEAIDSAVSNAVAGILQGADANTDNFSEVISYINSVDNASDLDLVAEMASVDSRFGSADTRFGGIDTGIGSLEVIDSAISQALATEISVTDAEIISLERIDSAVSQALANLDTSVGNINIGSLEVIDSAVSNALAAEILSTDNEVGSLEVIDSAVSNALAAEILATDNGVGSLEVIDSAISNALDALDTTVGDIDIASLEVIDSAISTALATEISTTDGEISAIQDSVDSLESQLNGFAKEAFIQGAFSGIVTGGGMTVPVVDTTGAQLDGGSNVTESAGVAVVDLVTEIEGANDLEREANLLFVTINGQYVNHDAVRINGSTSFSVIGGSLGFDLEADDVLEFKYIKN